MTLRASGGDYAPQKSSSLCGELFHPGFAVSSIFGSFLFQRERNKHLHLITTRFDTLYSSLDQGAPYALQKSSCLCG